MNAHTKRQIRKIISPFRRIGLKNFDFSIISNNCWGGGCCMMCTDCSIDRQL